MYQKEDRKTNPTGIRFSEKKLSIALSKSGKKSKQQLVDFLIERYINSENPISERQYEFANGANEGKIVPQNIVDLTKGNTNQPNTSYQPLDKVGIYREAILSAETLKEFKDIQKEIEKDAMHFKTKAPLYDLLQSTKEKKGFIYND